MKICISTVTSELQSYRLRLANSLGGIRTPDFEVLVQEDFRMGDPTLMSHIADLIGEADIVIQLVGNRCGYCPSDDHIRTMYAHIGQPAPAEVPRRSATQWEYHLAKLLGKRTMVYIAGDEVEPDDTTRVETEADTALQVAYKAFLHHSGEFTKPFANHNALVREVFFDLGLNLETAKPNNLPYKSIGALFKGRKDFLAQIKSTLGTIGHTGHRRAAAITGAPSTAIHGLGGIGKTRAAVEFAHANANEYTALLFVRADSPDNLQTNLANLCGAAVLNLPEKDARETEEQVAAVLHWLSSHPGWFLIFDNVDTEEAASAVEALLGRLSSHGQVLITSRLGSWSDDVEDLHLDVLSIKDAVDYLLESTASKRSSSDTDSSDAAELATVLGQLPLALTQASAYIRELGLSFRGYLQKWNEAHDKVIRWFDERQMKYPKSVAVTWETSFEQLTDNTRELMRILAWFAPDPIPTSILKVPVPQVNNQIEISADTLEEAEAQLKRYSLVSRDVDSSTFSVHRLVQDVTRAGMPEARKATSFGQALNWLNCAFVGNPQDVRSWSTLEPLLPHATHAAEQDGASLFPVPTSRLLDRCATLYQYRGNLPPAEPLFRRALAISEASLGPDDPTVATRLNNLALLLQATNRLAEAEPLYRRAIAIGEASLGTQHPDVAIRLNNLAELLRATNRLAEAEPLYRRALTIWQSSLGEDHPNVASALNNLAGLLYATIRLAEAEPLYRRALAIDEASYGPDHPEVATDLNNLAGLLQATNRLAEAEPLYRRALAIYETSYGTDHPNVATALNNLAELLRATKINPIDGAEMIWVPPGPFLMGDDDQDDNPRREVILSGYWMYKNVVTVEQYKTFCTATKIAMPPPPKFNKDWANGDHPIVNVNWNDANAYCKWAGVSLPTEAQWEKATRGTDGRKYPWGDDWDATKLWCSKGKKRTGTTSVGAFGISPYGCTDMAGNVWQWCSDRYDKDYMKSAPGNDPVGPNSGTSRVMRGGSWYDNDTDFFRASDRRNGIAGRRRYLIGFRCAAGP